MRRSAPIIGVLALVIVASWELARLGGSGENSPLGGAGVIAEGRGDVLPRDSEASPVEAGPPPERAAVAAIDDPEPGEDEISARWDELPPAERSDILERELRDAMDGARDGSDYARNVSRAESALSVLRAELLATEHGRARYFRLEHELDAIVEGNAGAREPRGRARP